jgi:phosphohistidine phosphatase
MELRNVCFVRHAKSSWKYPELSDIERPLNKRGFRDAPFMAKKMKELEVYPDLLISSPVKRALTTAMFFATEFGLQKQDLVIEDGLYGADPDDVIKILQKASNKKSSIFIFGHNPTFTMLANRFAGINLDNVPTCGIFQAKSMVSSWDRFSPDTGAFVAFYYPKQYLQ